MLKVKNLKIEYQSNSLALNVPSPRFSWQMEHSTRNAFQSAYQIQVATCHKLLESNKPNLWDSGKISSARQVYIVYKNIIKASGYYWRVRIWDQDDIASEYSSLAYFEMGPSIWSGNWIGTRKDDSNPLPPFKSVLLLLPQAPLLRREFSLTRQVHKARAYMATFGYSELYLNGKKVGKSVLDPAYSGYHKRVYYSSFDIAQYLQQGPNCVGVWLGQGWWGGVPKIIVQVSIFFADGSSTSIVSDKNWNWTYSPIDSHSIYHGETYNALLEQNWCVPNLKFFDKKKWKSVEILDSPQIELSPQNFPPIEVVTTLEPKNITSPKPGIIVYDFGQNFSGWCSLQVQGKKETEIILKYAELLYNSEQSERYSNKDVPLGSVNQITMFQAGATDAYVLKGQGQENYTPRFTYHGFRYVQVETGRDSLLDIDQNGPDEFNSPMASGSLKAQVVHTNFPIRGHFSCSNSLINQIHQNALWSFRSNFHGYPTDCPQRNERWGWLGDAHMTADMGLYNFELESCYVKYLQDIQDIQDSDGSIRDVAPQPCGHNPADPMWSLCYPSLLWDVFRHSADERLLQYHYPSVKKYVKYLQQKAPTYILEYGHYSDWMALEPTPQELLSTGGFLRACQLLLKMAKVLEQEEDIETYEDVCYQITRAFHSHFFDKSKQQYANGTQCSYVFPLYLKIVPKDILVAMVDKLIENIVVKNGKHLTTGFMGTRYLLDTLVQEGKAELAYILATQTTKPSWGYMIEKGATTMWEKWSSDTEISSHNHPPFAFISGWFYSTLAGIIPDEHAPGWQNVLIKPHILGDLTWVDAYINTIRGKVGIDWKWENNIFAAKITIPPNTKACVHLPKQVFVNPVVRENSTIVWQNGQGTFKNEETKQKIILQIGSGEYNFTVAETKT